MKQQWSALEPRQQITTTAIIIVAVVIVVTAALLQLHAREQQTGRNLQQRLAELRQVQGLVQQYQARHVVAQGAADATDLVSVVSGVLRDAGLQPTRLQQNSAEELQVRIDAAPYDQVIAALATLEQNPAVVLIRVTLTQGLNGTTGASLSLRKRQ